MSRITSWSALGLAFVVAFLVVFAVHALDFHGSVPDFRKRSGGGTLLDVKPAFSENAVYQRIEGYGPDGRGVYAFRNRTVDVVLPLGVFPFMVLFMLKATAVLRAGTVPRALLLVLPAAFVLFDFAENAVVLEILARYPGRDPQLAALLPYLTVVKRAASILALLVPAAVLGGALVRGRLSRVHDA